MEIRHGRTGRPPRRIESWFHRAFHSVEIRSPLDGRIKPCDQTLHRYRQFCSPRFPRFIQRYAPPQLTVQIVFLARRNVQIDPKAVWADLEFFVPPQIRTVRLQKCLSDIAIPKLVPPPIRLRFREDGNRAVARSKPEKQSFHRPQQPHFGFSFEVPVLSLPVCLEAQGCCALPGASRWKSLHVARLRHSNCYRCSLIHRSSAFPHDNLPTSQNLIQPRGFRLGILLPTDCAPPSSFFTAVAFRRASIGFSSSNHNT